MIKVLAISSNQWRLWRSLRIEALSEAPYAFAETLSDLQGDRDTEFIWRRRLERTALNVVAFVESSLAGMVSAHQNGQNVELTAMWVAPSARGRGVGSALVGAVVIWARDNTIETIELGVSEGNDRAINLYRRHGFKPIGDGRMAREVGTWPAHRHPTSETRLKPAYVEQLN